MHRPENDLTPIPGTNMRANAAGLAWWARMKAEQDADPHWRTRCLWADFQCPFARRGEGFICQDKSRMADRADVCTWNWKQERRMVAPAVQLSLFERVQTHETVWVHTRTGEVSKTYPAAVTVVPSCKQMAVAHVRWMETRQGWTGQTWRILPRTSTKADLRWKDDMIDRHGFRPCVFDEV